MHPLPTIGESVFLYAKINHFEIVLNIFQMPRASQQFFQRFAYTPKISSPYPVLGDYDIVVFVPEAGNKAHEILVYPAFYQISYHAFADFFGNAHPDFQSFRLYVDQSHHIGGNRRSLTVNVLETGVFP